MRKAVVYGFVVAAMSAAPAFAQQQPAGQQPRPGTAQGSGATDQPGDRPGGATAGTSGQSGTAQGGTRQGGGTQGTPQSGSGSQSGTRQSGTAGQADHQVVMDIAMSSMAEIEHGRLAQQKAQRDDVKQFAQRMVTDHTQASNELKSVASKKTINLPTALDAKHKQVQDQLSKLSGEAFDRQYMQHMVTAHREAVAKVRQASQGQDAEIKAWATKTLPTVEEHLKMAQSISGRAVGTAGSGSGSGASGATGSGATGSGAATPDRR